MIRINLELLDKQISDLLLSDIPEDSKTGLHNLLGEIMDVLTVCKVMQIGLERRNETKQEEIKSMKNLRVDGKADPY